VDSGCLPAKAHSQEAEIRPADISLVGDEQDNEQADSGKVMTYYMNIILHLHQLVASVVLNWVTPLRVFLV